MWSHLPVTSMEAEGTQHLVQFVLYSDDLFLSQSLVVWNFTFYGQTCHSSGLCSSCISFVNLFFIVALHREISVSVSACKEFLIHFNNGKTVSHNSGRSSSVIFLRPYKG